MTAITHALGIIIIWGPIVQTITENYCLCLCRQTDHREALETPKSKNLLNVRLFNRNTYVRVWKTISHFFPEWKHWRWRMILNRYAAENVVVIFDGRTFNMFKWVWEFENNWTRRTNRTLHLFLLIHIIMNRYN